MNHRFHRSLLSLVTLALLPVLATAATIIPASSGTSTTNATNSNNSPYTLNSGDAVIVTSGGSEAIAVGNSTGSITLNVNGTVSQAGSGRGIRSTTSGNMTIAIGSTGVVKAAADDAFQGRTSGTVNFTNLGTLYSGVLSNLSVMPSAIPATKTGGRGLNMRDSVGGGTVTNGAAPGDSALIRSDNGDAVRIGKNIAFTNYGTILAAGVVNDSAGNNALNTSPDNTSVVKDYTAGAAFSFEDNGSGQAATGSSLDNYGTVSGARHGVQAGDFGNNLTVTNRATGEIIGRNGSGVGFDTAAVTTAANITVNNYGLIRGDYAGVGNVIDTTGVASKYSDGDGDGVDIDGAATINNYTTGQIISTGAGGYDTSGRANNSEGISIGGGVIVNDGVIRGADRGIVVNNDSVASRSGVAATTITNNATGTIEGQNGFAIRLENKLGDARDNDTIINAGTITGNGSIPDTSAPVTLQNGNADLNTAGTLDGVTYVAGVDSGRFARGDGSAIQMGEGDDTLTNTGTITGNTGRAVNMEGGNDTVNFNGGTIAGEINGGAGTDTLNLGSGVSTSSKVMNFEQVGVSSGTATLSGVVSGTTLTKTGAGTLTLAVANSYTGLTTIVAGTLRVNNTTGSATGSGDVLVTAAAILAGNGIIGGNVTADGIIAPGNSVGTLTINGDLTWNGTAENAWQFELAGGNLSDTLAIGGDFKGTGTEFVFDFESGLTAGTFVLATWDGATTFAASDFSYINLGDGFAGSFAFNGSQLEFTSTAVPEPATWAALAGAAALGLAIWRKRAKRA